LKVNQYNGKRDNEKKVNQCNIVPFAITLADLLLIAPFAIVMVDLLLIASFAIVLVDLLLIGQ
jgi:hypothetical protein